MIKSEPMVCAYSTILSTASPLSNFPAASIPEGDLLAVVSSRIEMLLQFFQDFLNNPLL